MKARARRYVVWTIATLAIAALFVYALLPSPVEADLVAVARGALEVSLDEEGETRVRDRFVVSAPVSGRVMRIELQPGDPVRADETVLATFAPGDPALLDARSRAAADARVLAADAALATGEAERDRAAARAGFAADESLRVERLHAQGIVSDDVRDRAATEARERHDELRGAESAVERSRHELTAARTALIEPARSGTGGSMPIFSPIDGVVLRRMIESESIVPAGEPLLEVGDPAKLEVVADFLSIDAVRMQSGQHVRIEEWGGEGELDGVVRLVEPSGFTKISALGVEEQRVNVVIDFDRPREALEALGDRYRVEVAVIVWSQDDVLKVPTSSLFRHGAAWATYVVEGGRARLREVELGRRNGREAQVLSGLEAGERVVVHPGDAVVAGVAIEERS